MRQTIRVNAQVQWLIHKSAAGNLIGVCEPLALTAQGRDWNELHANIDEAMQLVLNDVLERRQLEQFLRMRGWSSNADEVKLDGDVEFDVPIELLISGRSGSSHAPH